MSRTSRRGEKEAKLGNEVLERSPRETPRGTRGGAGGSGLCPTGTVTLNQRGDWGTHMFVFGGCVSLSEMLMGAL